MAYKLIAMECLQPCLSSLPIITIICKWMDLWYTKKKKEKKRTYCISKQLLTPCDTLSKYHITHPCYWRQQQRNTVFLQSCLVPPFENNTETALVYMYPRNCRCAWWEFINYTHAQCLSNREKYVSWLIARVHYLTKGCLIAHVHQLMKRVFSMHLLVQQ